VRWTLSAFMRFCSASGIAPAEVDEVVLERFLRYRAQSGTVRGDASGRRLARTWNSNVGNIRGWPTRRLREPAVKPTTELPWTQFPEGLRRHGSCYPQGRSKGRGTPNRSPPRPLEPAPTRVLPNEGGAAALMGR